MGQSTEEPTRQDTEIYWRQYAQHIDLYKFYVGSLIRINLFYYAITGATLSFYFAHTSNPWAKHGLILPIIFSVGFCVLLFYGVVKLPATRDDMMHLCRVLGLGVTPEMRVLSVFLWVSGSMLALAGVGVLVLYGSASGFWGELTSPPPLRVSQRWLTITGLALDMVGAVLLAIGYFVSDAQAVERGVSRVASDSFQDNLKLPAVRERIRQSRKAVVGVCLLALGFLLQIIGTWPS